MKYIMLTQCIKSEIYTYNTVIYIHNHTCKENLVLLDRLLIYQGQFFRYILIQTFSFFLCLYIYLTMDLRWKTKHQTARKRFIRFLPALLAKIQIIINRIAKALIQLLYTFSLKRNHIA